LLGLTPERIKFNVIDGAGASVPRYPGARGLPLRNSNAVASDVFAAVHTF
jgi:hypothetical protein